MKILMTGASGFLGSHILDRLLADGHTVRAVVRDPQRAAARRGRAAAASLEWMRLDFAQALPIVVYRLSVLTAPAATPLYSQMKAAGRLIDEASLVPVTSGSALTNIQPAQMTREELAEGAEWLRSQILDPDNTIQRFQHYARILGAPPAHLIRDLRSGGTGDEKLKPFLDLIAQLSRDRRVRRVIECVRDLAAAQPALRTDLMQTLGSYLNGYARRSLDPPQAPPGARLQAVA